MAQIAKSPGVQGVFLYTPTALIISITDESGEHTFLRRVDVARHWLLRLYLLGYAAMRQMQLQLGQLCDTPSFLQAESC